MTSATAHLALIANHEDFRRCLVEIREATRDAYCRHDGVDGSALLRQSVSLNQAVYLIRRELPDWAAILHELDNVTFDHNSNAQPVLAIASRAAGLAADIRGHLRS